MMTDSLTTRTDARGWRRAMAGGFLALAAAILAGCGSGSSTSNAGNTPASTVLSVSVTCSPASIPLGQTSQCSQTVTGTNGPSQSVTWTSTGGTITSSGLFTPTVAGAAVVTATSTQDATKSGSATVTVTVPSVVTSVSVSCSPTGVLVGQTSQCSAALTGSGSYSSAVTWAVNGVTSGNNIVGTISGSGLYLAPTTVPSPSSVTVSATSQQDASKTGSATLSLVYPSPSITIVSPSSAPIGSGGTAITVTGTGFVSGSAITLNGVSIGTTYVSSTSLSGQIPASSEAVPGTIVVGVTNPLPGGGASNSLPFQVVAGSLTVNVIDLPSSASAAVTVTGPGGYSAQVTGTQTLQNLAYGSYTIAASSVHFGNYTYMPTSSTSTVNISSPAAVSSTVDYYNIQADTTKVLDATGLASLLLGADNSTLIISGQSTVAQSLNPGDILIVNACTAIPAGKVVRVSTVALSSGWFIVQNTPATLLDAYQQYRMSMTQQLDASSIPSVASLAKGVQVFRRPQADSVPSSNTTSTDPCANRPNLYVEPVDRPLNDDPNSPLNAVTFSGSYEFCPTLVSSFDWSWLQRRFNSIHFEVDLGEQADITTTISAGITFPDTKIKLFEAPFATIAGLVTPTITFNAGASGSANLSLSAETKQSASVSAGFDYANGVLTRINSISGQISSAGPPQIQGTATIKGYIEAELDADLAYGILTPYVAVSPYVQASADTTQNPWWTIQTGVDGEVGLEGDLADLFNDPSWSASIWGPYPLLHAAGAFLPTPATLSAIVPAYPVSSVTSQPISLMGNNLSTTTQVALCSSGSCTTFTPASVNSTVVTVNALLTPGNWQAQITDTTGNSNILKFVVTAPASGVTITALSGAMPQMSAAAQTLTFTGTSFVSGAKVTLCFANLCLAPQTVQISNNGNTASVSATMDHAGLWKAKIANPDGSESAVFSYQVAGPLNATIAPTAGVINSTQFHVVGSGATPNKAVTLTVTSSNGTTSPSPVTANAQGQFTYGPFTEATEGPYKLVFTDQTTGTASAPLTIVVSSGIQAQVTPSSGPVNTSFVVTGWGATPGATVRSTLVLPDTTVQNTTTTASSSGSFSFSAYPATQTGPYSAVYTDTSNASLSKGVTWSVVAGTTITASVSPASGVVNATSFTISGQGASANGGVTVSVSAPDNTTHVYHAQASGTNFAFAPLVEGKIGNYLAIVSDDKTGSQNDRVSWTVNPDASTQLQVLSVNPTSWTPVFAPGSTSVTVLPLTIAGSSGSAVNGTITSNQPWLLVDGHASETWTAPESIALNVNPTGLSTGSHTATLTITSTSATNSPVLVSVTAVVRPPLQITTTSIPDILGGLAYTCVLSASGGTGGGYKWSLAGGYLPYGISLDSTTGVLSGTPILASSTQSLNFSIQAEDSSGADATASFNVTYRPGLFVLDYSPSNFQFFVGSTYSSSNSITIPTQGGVSPISLTASGMPPGLSLNSSTGLITGIPTAKGNYAVVFNAQDPKGDTSTVTLTLSVGLLALKISTAALPSAQVGVAYQQYLSGTGGSQTGYTWSLQGPLPPGLQQAPTTGCTQCGLEIFGTPTSTGTYPLTITLTDSLGDQATEMLSLIVAAGVPPQIPAAVLPVGTVGSAYSFALGVTGGTPPYTWSLVGTSPDPGIQLSSAGVLAGTPSAVSACPSGNSSAWYGQAPANLYQVKVTDASGSSATQQFCLGVLYPTPVVTSFSPAVTVPDGTQHTITITGMNFNTLSTVVGNGSGTYKTTFIDSSHLTITLNSSPTALFAVTTTSGSSSLFGAGTVNAWVSETLANISNQNLGFTIADPPVTLSSVTAVLNNTTSPCRANQQCQLVVNGTGLVFDTQMQIVNPSTTLTRVSTSATTLPWNSITTTSFSVSSSGTYTLTVTNPNQNGGGTSVVQMPFTVSP